MNDQGWVFFCAQTTWYFPWIQWGLHGVGVATKIPWTLVYIIVIMVGGGDGDGDGDGGGDGCGDGGGDGGGRA